MSENKNNLWVKIALGTTAFVVSTWVSAYLSIQSANAQSFGFGTVTASTQYWYKVGNTGPDIYYADGKVGIGTTTPTALLDVAGSIIAADSVSASSFLYSSDRRLKTDIKPLNNILDNIADIGSYRFKWKDGRDDKVHIGLLAQEVEAQFPEVVTTGSDGYKAVDYAKLVPVLFEAIKEQQKEIDALKKQINE